LSGSLSGCAVCSCVGGRSNPPAGARCRCGRVEKAALEEESDTWSRRFGRSPPYVRIVSAAVSGARSVARVAGRHSRSNLWSLRRSPTTVGWKYGNAVQGCDENRTKESSGEYQVLGKDGTGLRAWPGRDGECANGRLLGGRVRRGLCPAGCLSPAGLPFLWLRAAHGARRPGGPAKHVSSQRSPGPPAIAAAAGRRAVAAEPFGNGSLPSAMDAGAAAGGAGAPAGRLHPAACLDAARCAPGVCRVLLDRAPVRFAGGGRPSAAGLPAAAPLAAVGLPFRFDARKGERSRA